MCRAPQATRLQKQYPMMFLIPRFADPLLELQGSPRASTAPTSCSRTDNTCIRKQSPVSSARKRPTKKARVSDNTDKVIEQALQTLNALPSTHDREEDFGNVANSLRQMHGDNKIHAEKLIHDLICMGKLGKLTSTKLTE